MNQHHIYFYLTLMHKCRLQWWMGYYRSEKRSWQTDRTLSTL